MYAAGDFIPPERKLCAEFGVARLTVRKSIALLLREKLLQSVPGAGTRVMARTPQKGDTAPALCCLAARTNAPTVLSPYYADIFLGIESEAANAHYHTLFVSYDYSRLTERDIPAWTRDLIRRGGFEVAILIGGISDEITRILEKNGIPVVLADKRMPQSKTPSVTPDNFNGAREATRHLLETGHRRIAFLDAPDDPVVRARYEGYLQAHTDAGLAPHPELRIHGQYLIEPACSAVTAFLKGLHGPSPTAILAVNDESAIGAMKALETSGIQVPKDCSVIGFDDISWAPHTHPPLTTVRIPREDMGRLAARMAIQMIQAPERPAPPSLVLQTELIVRETTAPTRLQK